MSHPPTHADHAAAPEDDAPTLELKHLLDDAQVRELSEWAIARLRAVPLGSEATAPGGSILVTTLLLDTPHDEVLHRSRGHRRRRFRVRRLGHGSLVALERRTRRGSTTRTRRSLVPLTDLALLPVDAHPPASWSGRWFRDRVHDRGLGPVGLSSYERTIFELPGSLGVRLALDRNLRAAPASGWSLEAAGAWRPLLGGRSILEVRSPGVVPSMLRDALARLGLDAEPISKFRASREALDDDPSRLGRPHA